MLGTFGTETSFAESDGQPAERKLMAGSNLRGILLQSPMAARLVVILVLLFAFAYGFAKLVERYGDAGDKPSPCEQWPHPDCPVPNAPPQEETKP
jgi:hypothetical protein